jgi:hypothetical protein
MVLRPLTCTRCGAALRDEPKDGLLRCGYCGQNHAFDEQESPRDLAQAQAQAPTRPKAARTAALALGALLVVAAVATLALTRGARESSNVVAGADGPGEPSTIYSAGQLVDVYWGSSWWPGSIKAVLATGRYRIGYDGWSSSWDEDVTPRRLRRRADATATPAIAAPTPGDAKAVYTAGEVVDIHWGQRWWPGRIVAVSNGGYRVSYDGWSSSYDETVDAARLRRR